MTPGRAKGGSNGRLCSRARGSEEKTMAEAGRGVRARARAHEAGGRRSGVRPPSTLTRRGNGCASRRSRSRKAERARQRASESRSERPRGRPNTPPRGSASPGEDRVAPILRSGRSKLRLRAPAKRSTRPPNHGDRGARGGSKLEGAASTASSLEARSTRRSRQKRRRRSGRDAPAAIARSHTELERRTIRRVLVERSRSVDVGWDASFGSRRSGSRSVGRIDSRSRAAPPPRREVSPARDGETGAVHASKDVSTRSSDVGCLGEEPRIPTTEGALGALGASP